MHLLEGLDFCERKEEPMADVPHLTQIAAGIILENNGEMDLVFEVALDRFDDRDPPFQCRIENIGAAARPETDAVPGLQFRSVHVNGFRRRIGFGIPGAPTLGRGGCFVCGWSKTANGAVQAQQMFGG